MTETSPQREPDDLGDVRRVLYAKLEDLEERARVDERAYLLWRRRYESLHFALGLPATGLATLAGATAFVESVSNFVVGVCAAGAALLSGVQTVIRPDRRAKFNQSRQFELARLAEDVSNLREIRLDTLEFEHVSHI
jgi:hypothetical protein